MELNTIVNEVKELVISVGAFIRHESTHFDESSIVYKELNNLVSYVDKTAGADIGSWIEVLRQARHTFDKDTFYVFGHSGEGYPVTGTSADLKAMAHFLKMSLRYVKKAKRQGTTLEQLLEKSTMIPGAPEYKGGGIERVLKAAWEEA